jgi:hypothetical protein
MFEGKDRSLPYSGARERLLGSFTIHEENEVLLIRPQGPYSQHFINFVT